MLPSSRSGIKTFSINDYSSQELYEERRARTEKMLELHEKLLTVEKLDMNETFHVRMLNYHNWNVDEAFHHILSVLEWRARVKPHLLTVKDLSAPVVDSGVTRVYACDRHERPTLLVSSGRFTMRKRRIHLCDQEATRVTLEDVRRVLVWAFERVLRRRTSGVSSFTVLYDRSSYDKKIHKHGEEAMLRELTHLANERYSGQMALLLVVGVDESERERWQSARDASKAKIDFLCGPLPDSRLNKFFHSGTLPASFVAPLPKRIKKHKKKKTGKTGSDWTKRLEDVERRVFERASELGLMDML